MAAPTLQALLGLLAAGELLSVPCFNCLTLFVLDAGGIAMSCRLTRMPYSHQTCCSNSRLGLRPSRRNLAR